MNCQVSVADAHITTNKSNARTEDNMLTFLLIRKESRDQRNDARCRPPCPANRLCILFAKEFCFTFCLNRSTFAPLHLKSCEQQNKRQCLFQEPTIIFRITPWPCAPWLYYRLQSLLRYFSASEFESKQIFCRFVPQAWQTKGTFQVFTIFFYGELSAVNSGTKVERITAALPVHIPEAE